MRNKDPADRALAKNKNHRSFLAKSYPTMKKANPDIPILLREASGTMPIVYARFGAFSHF